MHKRPITSSAAKYGRLGKRCIFSGLGSGPCWDRTSDHLIKSLSRSAALCNFSHVSLAASFLLQGYSTAFHANRYTRECTHGRRDWLSRIDKDTKEARNARIVDLWLACWTLEEIAAETGASKSDVDRTISQIGNLAGLGKSAAAAAEHATDFDPPIYNIWKWTPPRSGFARSAASANSWRRSGRRWGWRRQVDHHGKSGPVRTQFQRSPPRSPRPGSTSTSPTARASSRPCLDVTRNGRLFPPPFNVSSDPKINIPGRAPSLTYEKTRLFSRTIYHGWPS